MTADEIKAVFDNPLIPSWVNYISYCIGGVEFWENKPSFKEDKFSYVSGLASYICSLKTLNIPIEYGELISRPNAQPDMSKYVGKMVRVSDTDGDIWRTRKLHTVVNNGFATWCPEEDQIVHWKQCRPLTKSEREEIARAIDYGDIE